MSVSDVLNVGQSALAAQQFMMNAIGEEGLLGLTAVANSAAEAQALYERTVHAIDAEAGRALDPSGN